VAAPRSLFSFPDPVNEVSARLVAGGVVLMALAVLVVHQWWLLVPLAYGFVARVLTGPTLSPQGIGVVFSVSAAVLALGFHQLGAAQVVLGLLLVAATLESVFAVCLGCKLFALLMRAGLIPEEVCERCNDFWATSH
jgi:hypothetical protein